MEQHNGLVYQALSISVQFPETCNFAHLLNLSKNAKMNVYVCMYVYGIVHSPSALFRASVNK